MNSTEFIDLWFNKPEKRGGRYGDGRRYCNLEMDEDMLYSYGHHFPLVIESFEGVYILNGDRYSNTTSTHQGNVRWAVPKGRIYVEIPYTALNEMFRAFGSVDGTYRLRQVGFEARKLKLVDKRSDTWREVEYTDEHGEKKTRQEHLLGAVLFRYNRRYFLSGTDPSAKWGFGYFLSQLPGRPQTVDEAFEVLKPTEVQETESEWQRQGEWFFIREGKAYVFRSKLKEQALKMTEEQLKHEMRQYQLNGKLQPITFSIKPFITKRFLLPLVGAQIAPHHQVTEAVETPDGMIYCRGTVRHTAGDHKMLKLGSVWWRAVCNTQVRAWGAEGRID